VRLSLSPTAPQKPKTELILTPLRCNRVMELISLEDYVDHEGSTSVRGFALHHEFMHSRNPDVYPLYMTITEWDQEFGSYMSDEAEYRCAV